MQYPLNSNLGLHVWSMGRPVWAPGNQEQLDAIKRSLQESGYSGQGLRAGGTGRVVQGNDKSVVTQRPKVPPHAKVMTWLRSATTSEVR